MNKRNFLKELNIVQAMLCFREGKMIKLVLDYHLNIADKIVLLLDNYDDITEKIVLDYKNKYPEKIVVGYSTIPHKLSRKMPEQHALNRRFKLKEGEIRQELLDMVHQENKRKKIDMLLWGDADEVFTIHFPRILEWFWNQSRTALLCNHIQMIDDWHHFHNRKFYSHCKAFKYRPDISSVPIRGQCMLHPFRKYKDTTRGGHVIVHLADWDVDFRAKREEYKFRPFKNAFVWHSKKDIRELSDKEYMDIINNQKSISTVNEYLGL